jgi:hypothetical protein
MDISIAADQFGGNALVPGSPWNAFPKMDETTLATREGLLSQENVC